MKKNIIIPLLLLILSRGLYAQNTGCDNTFVKSLSGMGGIRPNIFPHPNGDFFATGLRNDSIVIVRFDQGGTALWAKAFQFNGDVLQIRDMYVDASGDLIGVTNPLTVNYLSDLRSTSFRYNLTSHTFVWIQSLYGSNYTQIHSLDADNCVMTGESNSGSTQLVRISKSTGTISGYNLEGEGGDFFSTVSNGIIYGTCRRYYNAVGDFRASVFAHDLYTGAFLWQNSIISRGNTTDPNETRMYPEKPVVDNDSLVVLASGDLEGFGGTIFGPSDMVVAKTNLTGDVAWTKQYITAGFDRPASAAIVSTAGGYYILGNLFQDTLNDFGFSVLIKTDKQGQVLWAKRLGISGRNITRNVMERNGFLFLTMSSDSYAPNDLLLIKLDQQGNTNTACDFIRPITVDVVVLPNIQDQRNYSTIDYSPTPNPTFAEPSNTSSVTFTYCNTPCTCPDLLISAGPDTVICNGQPVSLLATPGFDGYQWTPASTLDNPNIPNPIATPSVTTTYVVDAVKNGTELLSNNDFSQSFTGFSSDYMLYGAGYGYYYVANNAAHIHNLWFNISDHTPTSDNYMLVVDGDASGNFPSFWRQTVSVQPNTDYAFQFWGSMVYPDSPPEIQVKVNGVVQNSFTLLGGTAGVGAWQQYNLNINSGVATQLQIELIDLNTAGFGNDFAIDDVSLHTVCHYKDSVTVTVASVVTRAVSFGFCPGETVTIGGQAYTQPGIVTDTIPGTIGCDTIVTYTLHYLTPAPSTVTIQCPEAVNVGVTPGAGQTVAYYNLPSATSDCPCPGISMTLTEGLASGSAFPPGTTQICYTARDSCGHTASCCFKVVIREEQACDVKEIGCMKYELLTITADSGQNLTYRIRVTNYCANKMIYTAIELPNGITAVKPSDFSTFEAESGRKYTVRNPNFTPFYSIRFKSTTDSIMSGQSDILKYTLPAQSTPTYIHITSRLAIQDFYEAYLNTFNCPIGITPVGNKTTASTATLDEKQPDLRIFPNPTAGELHADLSAWMGETVQFSLFNAEGQLVQTVSTVAGDAPYMLQVKDGVANGLYILELRTSNGNVRVTRFVLQR
jgi:hypothetical protein